MNYDFIDMGAYNLHVIQTNKFKTITVEVNFREKLDESNITTRNLIKSVLLNTSKNYNTERKLIKETENLYDLKLISSNMRIGNYSNLSFKIRFLNEKYTEESMNEYSIAFLLDLIFNPDVENNMFRENVIKKCKKKLEKSIMNFKDNKLKYTLSKLLETTKDKPYSYNSYGTIESLNNITSNRLYDYYVNMITNNYVDIFIVGDISKEEVKNIFKKYCKLNTFKKTNNDILVSELKPTKKVNKYIENDDVNQTQLTVLCALNDLTEFERKYALLVYSELLGGSSNSMLFDTVREKNSYAYYVNASAKAYDNTMLIYAGIEPGNSDAVYKLIKKTLQDINKGKFEDELLDNSKNTIIAGIKASTDSPSGIINTYYAKELVGSKLFEERIENISKVSRDDIINISKKISIHTVYLLEGDCNEKN